jgi:hypothetical protein
MIKYSKISVIDLKDILQVKKIKILGMVATIFHQQETRQGVDPCFHFGLAVGLEFDQGWTAACSRTYSDSGCFATRTIDSFSDRTQKWQS